MSNLVGRHGVARATSSQWCYTWEACPRGAKLLLLTEAGIAILGHVGSDTRGYLAWAPLPDRDRAKEAEIAKQQGKEYL